ncbi:MAG: 30S ribosomal protein S8 [Nitrospinae bacterium RIFCSPLOWO2_02_FULL_39_110]|nr:MAG: 30S ribosomal protein S8 [Nitrospinae bacterium RIFCSPHIGHO2_02_39_11]OGV99936.1 MAG: 30S ribosomal protein S8 [Nitrospinae bacterium RIFCSPHIGHO2_12_FULL_39_42]OGW02130.1 MAG: 30S ribosomal protein S8 [Nitrospinae bacterium RIFCSPHIGHO2_02_FULL_39_82]OGW02319.1 MAG: 30S ribosomal protein S8 [Nitrospinae bacterium RIFCSPLOWO2_02_39_17]OGW04677.1 MAG: 30S ribosomal protein S8 [Nitrospinae bacterium RIFCSPLOWO2_02_FULL_39_110]OGW09910.1 MAG: 30S ribosomal protein S8 [Nitrospinae bacteriu
MSMTDPIADMLLRIRNAIKSKQEKVNMPASKLKNEIVKILKEEGFIKNFKLIKDRKQGILRIYLKYENETESVIQGLKRISKPGCKIYVTKDDIPTVFSGFGVAILSTNKGVLTDKTCREQKIGGEVLCHIW